MVQIEDYGRHGSERTVTVSREYCIREVLYLHTGERRFEFYGSACELGVNSSVRSEGNMVGVTEGGVVEVRGFGSGLGHTRATLSERWRVVNLG